jgi:hypothetical protein
MKAYRGVHVQIHIFLTLALVGGEWSASCSDRFSPGDWVDSRVGLDNVEKRKFLTQLGLELRPYGCPAHSQSLHSLRYPGFYTY